MSEWYEAKDEDIDIDWKESQVDILVTDNDFGNVYVTLTFEQIDDIVYKKNEGLKNRGPF